MEKITVNRTELLMTVHTNMAKHKEEHEKAVNGWIDRQIKQLHAALKQLREEGTLPEQVVLPKPVSYTEQYERAEKILQMSVESKFVLDEKTFDAWVMDNWGWKANFDFLNSSYLK